MDVRRDDGLRNDLREGLVDERHVVVENKSAPRWSLLRNIALAIVAAMSGTALGLAIANRVQARGVYKPQGAISGLVDSNAPIVPGTPAPVYQSGLADVDGMVGDFQMRHVLHVYNGDITRPLTRCTLANAAGPIVLADSKGPSNSSTVDYLNSRQFRGLADGETLSCDGSPADVTLDKQLRKDGHDVYGPQSRRFLYSGGAPGVATVFERANALRRANLAPAMAL